MGYTQRRLAHFGQRFQPRCRSRQITGDIAITIWKIWLVAIQLLLTACVTNGGGGSVSSSGGIDTRSVTYSVAASVQP